MSEPERPAAHETEAPIDLAAVRRKNLSYSDDGNAQRLVIDHGADLRYVPGAGWHPWDGRRWAPDRDGAVMRRAKDTARSLMREAAGIEDDKRAKALFTFARTSLGRAHLEASIKLAESEKPVITPVESLDRDPDLLNVENGTLHLPTGKLRHHRREDLITRLAPVSYEPEAPCPRWLAFLETVFAGDADLIAYVQRAVGYTLTGHTDEQCLFLAHGEGANGKTTLIETLRAICGDYGRGTDPALLLGAKDGRAGGPRPDLVALRGARFVPATEIERGARFAEVEVKRLTGGDTISARDLYQSGFEYPPEFKLWIAANHLPHVRGTDHAIWRRMRVIPFHVKIERPDRRLVASLCAEELPGILAWSVRGAVAWYADGLGEPLAVQEATRDYRGGEDTVAAFLANYCHLESGGQAPAGETFDRYLAWCDQEGVESLGSRAFPSALARCGITQTRTSKLRLYEGISLP